MAEVQTRKRMSEIGSEGGGGREKERNNSVERI